MCQIYKDINAIPRAAQNAVIAIGNFDGVHVGHQALLEQARQIAQERHVPFAVMTFEPHPRQFFNPKGDPFRLTFLPMKKERLSHHGVDYIFALAFDQNLSSLTGIDFIHTILKEKLQAQHIVVGEGFSFGHNKSGSVDLLKEHIPTTAAKPVLCDAGSVISSSRVRTYLSQGDFLSAATLLGWEWTFQSPVIHGQKNGRPLGYPTANQNIQDYLQLPFGVYAVQVQINGEKMWRQGAANFGIRPMFETTDPVFETFIFDFDGDLYGKDLRIKPLKYLRSEAFFETMDGLLTQMADDCEQAKKTQALYNRESLV